MKKFLLLCSVIAASFLVIACEKDPETPGVQPAGAVYPVIAEKSVMFDAQPDNAAQTKTVKVEYSGASAFTFEMVKLPAAPFAVTFDTTCTSADSKVTVQPGGCMATITFTPGAPDTAKNVSDSFVLGQNALALVGGITKDDAVPPKFLGVLDFGTIVVSGSTGLTYSDIVHTITVTNDTVTEGAIPIKLVDASNQLGNLFSLSPSYGDGNAIAPTSCFETEIVSKENTKSLTVGATCEFRVIQSSSVHALASNVEFKEAQLIIGVGSLAKEYKAAYKAIKSIPITSPSNQDDVTATFGSVPVNAKATTPFVMPISALSELSPEEAAMIEYQGRTLEFKQGFQNGFKINKEITTCTFIPETAGAFTLNISKAGCLLAVDFAPTAAGEVTFEALERLSFKALVDDPEEGHTAGQIFDMTETSTITGTGVAQ